MERPDPYTVVITIDPSYPTDYAMLKRRTKCTTTKSDEVDKENIPPPSANNMDAAATSCTSQHEAMAFSARFHKARRPLAVLYGERDYCMSNIKTTTRHNDKLYANVNVHQGSPSKLDIDDSMTKFKSLSTPRAKDGRKLNTNVYVHQTTPTKSRLHRYSQNGVGIMASNGARYSMR